MASVFGSYHLSQPLDVMCDSRSRWLQLLNMDRQSQSCPQALWSSMRVGSSNWISPDLFFSVCSLLISGGPDKRNIRKCSPALNLKRLSGDNLNLWTTLISKCVIHFSIETFTFSMPDVVQKSRRITWKLLAFCRGSSMCFFQLFVLCRNKLQLELLLTRRQFDAFFLHVVVTSPFCF